MINKCLFCGNEIDRKIQKGNYCSVTCYNKDYYRKNRVKKTCKICGRSFAASRNEYYCSSECKRIALSSKEKKCIVCETKFKGSINSKYCSELCSRISNGAKVGYEKRICYVCNKPYISKVKDKNITCSTECENKKIQKAVHEFLKGVET